MVQTRSQKNLQTQAESDAAITLLRIHKQSADQLLLNQKKEELEKLKLLKLHTNQYNLCKKIIDEYTVEMDRLEIAISELLSSLDY